MTPKVVNPWSSLISPASSTYVHRLGYPVARLGAQRGVRGRGPPRHLGPDIHAPGESEAEHAAVGPVQPAWMCIMLSGLILQDERHDQ